MTEAGNTDTGDSLGPIQRKAVWWASFATKYGLTTILAGVLLAVLLGFIDAPRLTGTKPIEAETRDAIIRAESNLALALMRLEALRPHMVEVRKSLDVLTCLLLMTPAEKERIKTRLDFDAQCGWLRRATPEAEPPEAPRP